MSDLTAEEQARVRLALRFLRTRCGSWERLAKVTHYTAKTLTLISEGTMAPSVTLAFRLARLAQVATDDVIAGIYPAAGACPHCGHTPPAPPPA
jgi:DNA-binding XRE family transcriptional regulator